jgi:HD-GYP domain-containing protein (c-di-GMP phosphodiesterase class II)/serine/threonine protein phosphatase PrpC
MAAILLFGAGVASWLGIFARLLTNTSERWSPISKAVLKLGQAALSIGVAGWVYAALGGNVGAGLFDSGNQILVALAAAGSYLLVNSVVGTIGVALNTKRATVFPWFSEARERIASVSLTLPFGALVALTQLTVGPLGVALFLVPLLLARYVYKLWIEMKKAHLDTVRILMSALDAMDPFTRGHSYRISKMCARVGRHLEMNRGDQEQLEYASLLHDIGRTAIQHNLLSKAGKLTDQEHTIVQAHPKIGSDILSRLKFFQDAAAIVHAHHEQPDGKGYPRGVSGDGIPLGSRIIMVVAAFDAMTSDRPYRRGLSPDAAFEELLNHAATQFFTEVVEALIELYTTGALFDDFEEEELEQYAEGQRNSRALDQFLNRAQRNTIVPEKVHIEEGIEGVPIIEMPDLRKENQFVENEYVLDEDGDKMLVVAGASDLGCVRGNNEDSFGIFGEEGSSRGVLLILADGMGGEAAGEVASSMAVDTVRGVYFGVNETIEPVNALNRAVELANQAIFTRASSDHRFEGMGTTCTVSAIVGTEMIIGHIGDSRAYLVADGEITLLTRDHTLAAELADMAGTDNLAAGNASNVLTRCLGSRPDVEVDVTTEPISLEKDDVVVLCSDGLSNMVEASEIQEGVSESSPADACRRLVEMARERGGPDNITVQVARVA